MYRCALPEGPVRSASRGSPAASSIRLALRTSSIVATRRASFVRWVLRCFGRRRLSSAPKPSAISLMPSIMRFQEPPKAESLNHTSIPHVNNLPAELIDGKAFRSLQREFSSDHPMLLAVAYDTWRLGDYGASKLHLTNLLGFEPEAPA